MWSRDGRELFYVNGKTLMAVPIKLSPSFDFSSGRKVCDLPANALGITDAAGNGKEFLVWLSRAQDAMSSQVNVVVGWFGELKEKFQGNKQ